MTGDEMKETFDGFDHAQYEREVEERWGETPAYRESAKRTKQYGKAEWQRIKAEAEAITSALANALQRALPADGDVATGLAEQHRLHIDRWFYPCSHAMQCCLAEMYVADPRFAASYDQHAPGLSAYVREAILANAQKAGAE